MTVAVTNRRVDYTATGSTVGPFAVPFQFFEIAVYKDGVLVPSTDYTISQSSPGGTGNVTFNTAPTGAISIRGNTRRAQEVDLTDNDDLPADTLERALDRLSMAAQEDARDLAGIGQSVIDAATYAASAQASASSAASHDSNSAVQAATASTAATAASASQTAAANSATAAANSASTASTAATGASASQTAAAASAAAAAASQTAAATSATGAAASQVSAANSATAAATSQTAAANSASAAATSASNAATSETNAAASAAAAAANAVGTSATSLAIGAGTKVFTTQSGKQWSVGQFLIAASASSPLSFMVGQVTDYVGTTLTMTVTTNFNGSGSFTDWQINVTGSQGTAGSAGAAGGAFLETPAYVNTGGQGDRTASITAFVTPSLLGSGTASRLVDGSTVTPGGSISFNAVAAAGLVIRFDFGAGARRVITEVTWTQNTSSSHGVWQWQGSNDGVTWDSIGTTFTLGGATTQIITTMSASITGYRFFQFLGVSGTASNNPYLQEVTFKIAKTVLDKAGLTPTGGSTNSALVKASASDFDFSFLDLSTWAISAEAKNRLPSIVSSYYPCDEGTGTTLRDIIGNNPASINNGGGTVAWNARGWLQLTNGWFKLPSQTMQGLVVTFRQPEGSTGYFFCTPNGTAIGQSYISNVGTTKIADGWGIKQLPTNSSAVAADILAGGWCMASVSQAASSTGIAAIGSGNNVGAGAGSSLEVSGIFVVTASPTDTQLRQIILFDAERQHKRGIYLTPWHCPRQAHLALVTGESTSEGTFLLSSLSANQRAAQNESVLIDARNVGNKATTGRVMNRLSLAATYANNNATSSNTKSGLEVGILNARIARTNNGRPLHIQKAAQGSTYLLPSATYTNASGGSTIIGASQTRYHGEVVTAGLHQTLEVLAALRAERLARNDGIGYTRVTVLTCEGLNDAYIGSSAITSAAQYQTYLQDKRDALRAQLGISNLKQVYLKPHNPSGGLGGGDADYPNDATGTNRLTALGYIRTAITDFATANSSDVQTLDGDSYSLNTAGGDYVHPNATGYDNMGQAMEAGIAYSTEVIPYA